MRIGTLLATSALLTLAACAKKNTGLELTASHVPPPDYVMEPDVTPVRTASYETSLSDPAPMGFGSSDRTHVVQPRDTLYGLARAYYSDPAKWKKIYKANQDKLDDPNKIAVGMKLVIP